MMVVCLPWLYSTASYPRYRPCGWVAWSVCFCFESKIRFSRLTPPPYRIRCRWLQIDWKFSSCPFPRSNSSPYCAVLGSTSNIDLYYLSANLNRSIYVFVFSRRLTETESWTCITYPGGSSTRNLDSSLAVGIQIFAPCVLSLLSNRCPNSWTLGILEHRIRREGCYS